MQIQRRDDKQKAWVGMKISLYVEKAKIHKNNPPVLLPHALIDC